MNLHQAKFFIPLIIGLLAIGLVVLLLINFVINLQKPVLHTSSVENTPDYNQSYKRIADQVKPEVDQQQKVAQLLTIMPYHGKLFSIDFSYTKGEFIVILSNTQRNAAESEYQQFLTDHGITEEIRLKYMQDVEIQYK